MQRLSHADEELCKAASDLLSRCHDPDRHRVAVAARGASGRTYLGLSLLSNRVSICAEPAALANAAMAGETGIESIVAVGMGADDVPRVINPCGICRELVPAYAPDAAVIVDDGGEVRSVHIAELLPIPWVRARSYS